MIYKVNLRTACGCTKSLFESGGMSLHYKVPIRATKFAQRDFMLSPGTEIWDSRVFALVDAQKKSARRTELWYEEVIER